MVDLNEKRDGHLEVALSPPASAQGLGWEECLRAGLSPDSETAVQQDGSAGCVLTLTPTSWTHTTWPRQLLTPGHQGTRLGWRISQHPPLCTNRRFSWLWGRRWALGRGGRAAPAEPAPQSHRWAVILAFTVFLPSDRVTLGL